MSRTIPSKTSSSGSARTCSTAPSLSPSLEYTGAPGLSVRYELGWPRSSIDGDPIGPTRRYENRGRVDSVAGAMGTEPGIDCHRGRRAGAGRPGDPARRDRAQLRRPRRAQRPAGDAAARARARARRPGRGDAAERARVPDRLLRRAARRRDRRPDERPAQAARDRLLPRGLRREAAARLAGVLRRGRRRLRRRRGRADRGRAGAPSRRRWRPRAGPRAWPRSPTTTPR